MYSTWKCRVSPSLFLFLFLPLPTPPQTPVQYNEETLLEICRDSTNMDLPGSTGRHTEAATGLTIHPSPKARYSLSKSRVVSDLTLETTVPGSPWLKGQGTLCQDTCGFEDTAHHQTDDGPDEQPWTAAQDRRNWLCSSA